jgi:hypothetical protein
MDVNDRVSMAVLDEIQRFVPEIQVTKDEPEWLTTLFRGYLSELRYIQSTHTL